jgi:hypothetical protein
MTPTSGINGNAGGGQQILLLSGERDAVSTAGTVCHELGHSMGMTIVGSKNSPHPPGMVAPRHVDNGGTYYLNLKDPGPWVNGLRNLHVGGHCANGVSDSDKVDVTTPDRYGTKANFRGWSPTDPGTACIMWGSGGSTADPRRNYCKTCLDYIRARRLVNVRNSPGQPA